MRTLIIDSSALCYQAAHATGGAGLSYGNQQTGVIFGFLIQLLDMCEALETNNLIFCWDGPRDKSVRRQTFPGYKNRDKGEMTNAEKTQWEINFQQFHQLRTDIVPKLGVQNSFYESQFEADDLIASIVTRYADSGYEFIVVSSDEDLYQLLSYCSMYKLRKKQLYTSCDFVAEYGIPTRYWAEVKAMAGCSTDTVPGIPGIGEKTAIKYLRNELKEHTKAFKAIHGDMHDDLFNRNLSLVSLPHGQCPPITLHQLKDSKILYNNFIDVCQWYGLQSFITGKYANRWEELLKK